MAQTFNTILSFVKSTSRKDRRKGVGSLSVSAVAGGGVGSVADSATQAWVRDNFVDKTTEQEISALKIFSQGIKIGDVPLFKHPDGYVYLDSSLVLSGGVTMYGDDGTTVKPIWESIPFDRTTIDWVDGKWTVVGGVGSGGISEEFLNVKLQEYQPLLSTTNKLPYSLISGIPDLSVYAKKTDIPSLNGYATQTWVEGKGYLLATTASSTYQPLLSTTNKLPYSLISGTPNLSVYALKTDIPTKLSQLTDDVVAGKYLSLRGGTMSGSITTRTNTYSWSTAKTNGHIIAGHTPSVGFAPIISTGLQSGGYGKLGQVGDNFGLYAYSSEGTSPNVRIELSPEDGDVRIYGHINPYTTNSYNLGNSNAKWGNIYATSFIGNLTGNADSAYKLVTNDGDDMVHFGANILYVGNTIHVDSQTHLLGKSIRLRYGASAAVGMTLTETGNVAIGSTTADAKLHVHGTAKFTGGTTFSSKVVIGTIPVYQSADGTLFVDANVVFRGGVAMYGDTTTTINEE